ncbi:MAG TPA: HypC/HybG/HupF family hydrogenase formation chaperone [Acidimicrobiales bacterium]|nr:HypC/HybG/HupF family hydrogenase formation chaperone [Acidimicrobiales bacterium]
MCLGIPGLVTELDPDGGQLASVDVSGAKRRVNIALLADEGVKVGDWVLIHVGFALARLDEEEAHRTIEMLEGMESAYYDELSAMGRSAAEPQAPPERVARQSK